MRRPKLIVAGLLVSLASAAVLTPSQSAPDPEVLRAKAVLEDAIKKDPKNSELWLHLGFVFKKLDDVDATQKAFEKTIELNPKNASAHYMLGLIYEKKKDTDKAIAAWNKTLELATDENVKETARKHLAHLQKK